MAVGTSKLPATSEHQRSLARWVSVVAVLPVILVAATAWAQVNACVGGPEGGLCPSGGTSCTVWNDVVVQANSFLDCSGMDVNIAGDVTVLGGTFGLSARSLGIAEAGSITAVENATVEVGFDIEVENQAIIWGKLIAHNAGGLSYVYLRAGQYITLHGINPGIDVSGSADSCDGGDILLVSDGDITVTRQIDASGKEGGTEGNFNSGGTILLSSGGNVWVTEEIRAVGRDWDGGVVEITADGWISIDHRDGSNLPKGQINVEGKQHDGYGGVVDLISNTSVTISGPIYGGGGINNAGGYSLGGTVGIEAGCGGVLIDDVLDLRGGSDGGGYLSVYADGPVTSNGEIQANSRNHGGSGGTVVLSSGGRVTVGVQSITNVDAHDGTLAEGYGDGGVVLLQGCEVVVADDPAAGSTAGAKISALGATGGEIYVEGSKAPLSSSDFSVLVGDKSTLNATGEAAPGGVAINVTERRFGKCSNNLNATCQTSQECVYNCSTGSCDFPNPDTQNSLAQFTPAPTIFQQSGLLRCTSICN